MKAIIVKSEKLMNVSAIAESLGVSKDTIKNAIRRVFPQKMQHGKTTLLNEAEVTLILEEIKKNQSVMSHSTDEVISSVANAETSLTPALMIKQAMELAEKGYQLELARIKAEKENLQIQLDESKEWYSIKRMQKLNPDEDFSYTLLKKESRKLDIPIKKVFDSNYGEVNAYHREVWESLYSDTINYGD